MLNLRVLDFMMDLHVVDLLVVVLYLVPDQVTCVVCFNSGIFSIHQQVVLLVQFFLRILFKFLQRFDQKSLLGGLGLVIK